MVTGSHAGENDDLRAILQLALNDPALTQYYHFDVRPERLPLAVANRTGLPLDPTGLTAAGQPVARGADDAKSLVVTAFKVSGDEADISLTYRVEGVIASGRFSRAKGQWKTEKMSVAEGS